MLPTVLVIMGVSGSGKTTIASLLAESLRCDLSDADSFHPAANVDKMAAGVPLNDEDRWPWLHAIADWIDAMRRSQRCGIVACSALKRSYRDIIIGARRDVRLVYLKGDAELIRQRMSNRSGHFMPTVLLQSQLDTLEEPGSDENPIVVSIDAEPRTLAEIILEKLQVRRTP
jgi:carbohydrate kinase (thermoresistant glucokinase family)